MGVHRRNRFSGVNRISFSFDGIQEGSTILSNGIFLFIAHTIISPVHHTYTRVGAKFASIPLQKIPIKVIEGACIRTVLAGDFEATALAVV